MEREYIFKASTVEMAIKNGLTDLGISEEDVDIEVISEGGIFSKATVKFTLKEKVEEIEEITPEVVEDEITTEDTLQVNSEKENKFGFYKELKEKGKEFIKEMARLMGVSVTVEGKIKDGEVNLYIGGEDARAFIGYKGETIDAVQTIVSQYLNKGVEEHVRVVVDSDFYRERRKKTLTNLAKKLAKQAYSQRREIALEPMNSYERRIIHSALQNSDEASTRSDGEGKDRHIVIVPKIAVMSYGNSSDFKKKGPAKTKSFGYNKRRF